MVDDKRQTWTTQINPQGQAGPLYPVDPRPDPSVAQGLAAFGRPGRPTRPQPRGTNGSAAQTGDAWLDPNASMRDGSPLGFSPGPSPGPFGSGKAVTDPRAFESRAPDGRPPAQAQFPGTPYGTSSPQSSPQRAGNGEPQQFAWGDPRAFGFAEGDPREPVSGDYDPRAPFPPGTYWAAHEGRYLVPGDPSWTPAGYESATGDTWPYPTTPADRPAGDPPTTSAPTRPHRRRSNGRPASPRLPSSATVIASSAAAAEAAIARGGFDMRTVAGSPVDMQRIEDAVTTAQRRGHEPPASQSYDALAAAIETAVSRGTKSLRHDLEALRRGLEQVTSARRAPDGRAPRDFSVGPQEADQREAAFQTCSFCERREDEVGHLIAGLDGSAICDDCVRRSVTILDAQPHGHGNGKITHEIDAASLPAWAAGKTPVDPAVLPTLSEPGSGAADPAVSATLPEGGDR